MRIDLTGHRKRFRFEELAGTKYGLHFLTLWFAYVCAYAPTGDISDFNPREISRACEWPDDPQKFWDALQGAGFIEQTSTGYIAHDWEEENGYFLRESLRLKEIKQKGTRAKRVQHVKGTQIENVQNKQDKHTEQEKDQNLAPSALVSQDALKADSPPLGPQDTTLPPKGGLKGTQAPKKAIVGRHPEQDKWWTGAKVIWNTKFPASPLQWPGPTSTTPIQGFQKKLNTFLDAWGAQGLNERWFNCVNDPFTLPSLRVFFADPEKFTASRTKGVPSGNGNNGRSGSVHPVSRAGEASLAGADPLAPVKR